MTVLGHLLEEDGGGRGGEERKKVDLYKMVQKCTILIVANQNCSGCIVENP